jgi:hypothetical protein
MRAVLLQGKVGEDALGVDRQPPLSAVDDKGEPSSSPRRVVRFLRTIDGADDERF